AREDQVAGQAQRVGARGGGERDAAGAAHVAERTSGGGRFRRVCELLPVQRWVVHPRPSVYTASGAPSRGTTDATGGARDLRRGARAGPPRPAGGPQWDRCAALRTQRASA